LNKNLVVSYDGQPPNLLLALAADKVLFNEAKSIYLKTNAVTTANNEAAYKAMKLKDLLCLRHIILVAVERYSTLPIYRSLFIPKSDIERTISK
jgi:hypothetical protein